MANRKEVTSQVFSNQRGFYESDGQIVLKSNHSMSASDVIYSLITNKMGNETATNCLDWWCDQRSTLLVLKVIVIALCVIGSFGNLITILAIVFSNLRRNVNCILIGSLSLAGFLYCSLILSLQAVIFHRSTARMDGIFCQALGGLRYTLVGVIMVHLSVVAFYRYVNIVHLDLYHKLSSRTPLMVTILISWTLPLPLTLPPAIGKWGAFCYQSAILACTYDSQHVDHSNRYMQVTLGFIVPCIFITFCYARIGCVAYLSSKRISNWSSNASQSKALRLSAMMLCIFSIFFLGTFPYFIINVYDKEFRQPVHHLWSTIIAWVSYCLNPVVYTVMDTNFRTAYRRFLTGDCERNPMRRRESSRRSHV
ncbi:hypothetical protein FSP39_019173 [Pinctada imbricata]|uniref:G-protein coupled receptors family 1 profile domain-containing protein n=1 Tax=Pinctada imbricata TaxID=66713 RepID=A0AA89BRI6_PINIB|nr:hypothetical protein FSP39_019173 [Pinctada imbricata]